MERYQTIRTYSAGGVVFRLIPNDSSKKKGTTDLWGAEESEEMPVEVVLVGRSHSGIWALPKGKNSYMQHKPSYALMRRILYPYNGEEPLSLKQGLRVVLAWMLFFPLCLTLLTLPIAAFSSFTPQRTAGLLIFAFLSGVFIF